MEVVFIFCNPLLHNIIQVNCLTLYEYASVKVISLKKKMTSHLTPYAELGASQPVQLPETDTGPSSPHYGEKKQTMSAPIPLMTGTALSQNPGILASEGNPASHVRADGRNNMSLVLTD